MGVEALQHELGGGYLGLHGVFCGNVQRTDFFHETLNAFHRVEHLFCACALGDFDFSAQIEPLHDLAHVHAAEVIVEGFCDRSPNQFAAHMIGALHFAFVLEFQLARNRRQGGVDIADAGDHGLFSMPDRAPLRIRDHVLGG